MFSAAHSLHALYDAVEKLSVQAVAKIGVAGAVVATASAIPDPGMLEPWLRLLPLGLGSLTGVGALVLIVLKNVQQVREMRNARPRSK